MVSLLQLGFVFTLLFGVVRADFAGCLGGANVVSASPYVSQTGITSELACQLACATFKYSLYQASPTDGRSTCYCAPAGTSFRGNIVSSTSVVPNSTPRQCVAVTDYRITMLSTTFTFDGCFTQSPLTAAISTNDFSSVDECATTCRFYRYMAVLYTPNTTPGSPARFYCYCGVGPIFSSTAGACSATRPIQFTHTAAEATGGLTRRRLHAARMEKERSAKNPCPGYLKACKVHSDNEDDYECLDVSSELESCGGCVNGDYKSAGTASSPGEDCSALSGATMGGVTCTSGKCMVYSCLPGHALVDSRCERLQRRQRVK